MPDLGAFSTRAIVADDPASGFACGEKDLDQFFALHALGNHQKHLGRVFVLGSADGTPPTVRGYYTLSMAEIDRNAYAKLLPRARRQGLPKYPIPAALIGRFAVHSDVQGDRGSEKAF